METIQVARVLTFPAFYVPHISWDSIGAMRAQLGCDIDVRRTADAENPSADALTITLFWPNTEDKS